MALTRKMLKAMGIEEEKIEQIIDAHAETVDGLKSDITKYKDGAEKLSEVQKELDTLKARGDDGWKEKHDKIKKDFEEYKSGIESEKSRAAKEKAARAYFEGKNIIGKSLDIAMRASAAEIGALEMDGEKIKDTASLDGLIAGDLSALVGSTGLRGHSPANPPENKGTGGGKTKEEIMAIRDGAERRKAMLENPELFGLNTKN
ncbi:MAG: hypothetical protein IKU94_00735 [Bacteroidaceae bacterium]|nr:hypothetical protein [Bacteroidaceae bacterium]MBR4930437.1 hypothetical protein [Bacteroidaceae bacterium]